MGGPESEKKGDKRPKKFLEVNLLELDIQQNEKKGQGNKRRQGGGGGGGGKKTGKWGGGSSPFKLAIWARFSLIPYTLKKPRNWRRKKGQ